MKTTADKLIQWEKQHRRMLICAVLVSLLFVCVLNFWNDKPGTIRASRWLMPAMALCMAHVEWPLEKRKSIAFGLLAAVIAFFVTVDPLVYTVTGVTQRWTAWMLPVFAVFWMGSFLALYGLSSLLARVCLQEAAAPQRKELFCFWGALVVFWLPVVLSFGPLRISADSYNVIRQALGSYQLNDSHPIVYTLVLRLFLLVGQAVGSLTAGAWLFGLAQMLFFSFALAFGLFWLRKQGAPRLYVLLAIAYYGLTPVFAVNSITAWKDIPFNAVLLLLSLSLYTVAKTRGEALRSTGGMLAFLGLALAVCFLRGNGFYIVLLAMAAIALCFRRHWRRWCLFFLPFLLAVTLIQGPLYSALGIGRLGGVESAALPLQQVARAVAGGAPLNQEQTATLEKIIPVESLKAAYVSASPDPIKTHPEFDARAFDENFGEFMGVWGQLLKTNKQMYMDAWLLQTLGYWKVDFHGWTALVTEYEESTGIVQTDVWNELFGWNSRDFFAQRTEFLSLSLMAYVALFCIAHMVAQKRGRFVLFCLPMLVLWLGMMLGAPAYAEFRYMLLYPLLLPCLLYVALQPQGEAPAVGDAAAPRK